MKKGKKIQRPKKRKATPERMIVHLFVLSVLFYCAMKIGLNSQNITLSIEEQRLAREMTRQQQQVEQLASEVNQLEEKTRVLGLLDESVADNQKNVYIID